MGVRWMMLLWRISSGFSGGVCGLEGKMESEGDNELYILISSSHLGPLTKSSVAKYPAVMI
jgi:hypothetical protein